MIDSLHKVMAAVFGVTADRITDGTSRLNMKVWDSMRHITLILALEDEFALRFEPHEISAMTDTAAISRIIKNKLNAGD